MGSNIDQFRRELNRAARRLTGDELVRFHRRVTLEALVRLVERSPRDIGHFVSNWQVTIGQPSSTELPGANPPDVTAAIVALAALGPFQATYVANPTKYGSVLDLGLFVPENPGPSKDPRPGRQGRVLVQGGFSTQAPQGLVAITLRELRQFTA
ncbi:MAG: hypothetical protein GY716_15705 [bacterium]|nr:hypothetical protein [bacterium]